MFEVSRKLSYYLNVTDPLIIPVILTFNLVVKRIMIPKSLVVKIQNIVMNHISRLVKLNPVKLSRHIRLNPTNIALLLQAITQKYQNLTDY